MRALAYWNEGFPAGNGGFTNLRIDSDPASLRTYRRSFRRAIFTGRSTFEPRP